LNRVVCIVGMHRSGTSCLAGSLEESGLCLGDVFRVGRHNLKGNRENGRIMALQEDVLVHSGGSWNRPPNQASWSAAHQAERDSIIRSYGDASIWGFKDPRTLLLVDFWREALPDAAIVGTLRHPHCVVASLQKRGGGTIDEWLDLWAHYNRRLLALYDAAPFPVVRFDLGEQAYRRSLMAAMDHLGLRAPARPGFFDPLLRHHERSAQVELLEPIAGLYEKLCQIAVDG
jgi:hypothetical protein